MTARRRATMAAAIAGTTLPAHGATWPAGALEAAALLAFGAGIGCLVVVLEDAYRRRRGEP